MSESIRYAARTDVGRQRELNEDSVFVSPHVFVVADGLGGHKGGEVASALAIETISPLAELTPSESAGQLSAAIFSANRTILGRARSDAAVAGMGTTITAVVIDGPKAHLAHVGDSRAYLIRHGGIEQLTEDHTMVGRLVREGRLSPEEAERHPQRSMLTRALGSESSVRVDESQIPLLAGDRLLLCSDGLTNMLSDAEIGQHVRDGKDLQEICDALIDAANARGGIDNITAALIEMPNTLEGSDPAAIRSVGSSVDDARPQRRSGRRALVWSAIVLTLLLATAGGLRAWANSSWFVGDTGGEVAVFQGLPMDLPLVRLRRVIETTGITIGDLPDHLQREVRRGITATSREDARRIVTAQIAPNVGATAEPPEDATPPPTGSPSS